MPTSYTGVPTATQAPSGPPVPGGSPIVSIPIDGESENAASVTQMVKVLADWIAFGRSPRARVGQYAEPIIKWASALLHSRLGIDHLGFLMGRVVRWEEDWSRGLDITGSTISGATGTAHDFTGVPMAYDVTIATSLLLAAIHLNNSAGNASKFLADAAVNLATASGAGSLAACQSAIGVAGTNLDGAANAVNLAAAAITAAGNALVALTGTSSWKKRVVQTTGSSGISFVGPDSAHPRHRYAVLFAGDTSGDMGLLYRKAPALWDDGLHLAMEWEGQLSAASTVKTELAAGLCRENGTHFGAGQASDYAVFVAPTGGGNWSFQRRSAAGSVAVIDTGVALTANLTRFRIEFHGATVAEDALRSIRAYINGTKVVDVATTIPVATAEAAPHFAAINTVGGSGGASLTVAAPKFSHNLYPSDVF